MPRRGDINGDGIKDANDVNEFVNSVLDNQPNANYRSWSDWSGDNNGIIDSKDIQGFVQNYLAP